MSIFVVKVQNGILCILIFMKRNFQPQSNKTKFFW